jgi:two-component system, NtrC family, sensor kinase
MRFLINIPIRQKLTTVILLASTAGLVVATSALFFYQLATFRTSFVGQIRVLSQIVASQSEVAATLKYAKDADEILSALKANQHIISAVIDLNEGGELARFGTESDLVQLRTVLPGTYVRSGRHLLYAHPITVNSNDIGALYLRADYETAFREIVRAHVGILALVFIGSILLTLVLSTRLQRIISDPILRLADTAKMVAQKKDYSARAEKLGNDELGLFTEAFNQMLAQIQTQASALQSAHDQLEDRVNALQREIAEREKAEHQLEIAHRELVEASRRAGMAEVATGVLHNVGNVLNSVNVSASLLRDTAYKSEVNTVDQLATLLRAHADDLPRFLSTDIRGRRVPQLLTALAQQLTSERSTMVTELELLAKNIDHIKNIVAMQQNYASVAGFLERSDISDLVEDALEINAAGLTRHGVEVVRMFEPVPLILLDKHKILQVLVNLIQNAKYALEDAGPAHKRLTIRVRMEKNQSAHVIVQDNGVGIAAEHLTRIFAHGFTTRKKGHGFGLHASALTAREMGGNLTAHSDGPGKGASFILEVPLEPHRERL